MALSGLSRFLARESDFMEPPSLRGRRTSGAMTFWITIFGILASGVVGFRLWYLSWKRRRIEARRKVELPNSHYASKLVKHQIDRERWGELNISLLHEVNQEEVERLLGMVDALGPDALSSRERIFLDHLTSLRFG